jgi:catechol O-methyltransferase
MPILWVVVAVVVGLTIHSLLGKPVPFLRWSVIRMLLGMKKLMSEWQVGDGREEAAAAYVVAHAPAGDLDAAIRAIDEYAHHKKFLINVGDEKGATTAALARPSAPCVTRCE